MRHDLVSVIRGLTVEESLRSRDILKDVGNSITTRWRTAA